MTARKSYFRKRYAKDREFREVRRRTAKETYRRNRETLFMRLGGKCSVCGKMAMAEDTLVIRWANGDYMTPAEQLKMVRPQSDQSKAALFCKYNRHLRAPWFPPNNSPAVESSCPADSED